MAQGGDVAGHEEGPCHGVGLADLVERALHGLGVQVHHQGDVDVLQHLAKGWNARLPAPDPAHLGQLQIGHVAFHAPQAGECRIVQHDDLPVAGAPQVELDHVSTFSYGGGERGQRVLALGHRITAVRNGDGHGRASTLSPARTGPIPARGGW